MAEIIVNTGNRYSVEPLYQWDKNQILKIYGVHVLDPEIHFSNNSMTRSIVQSCTVDDSGVITVTVPNSLLQYSEDVIVHICGYEGATFKTYYKIVVPTKARSKPADYVLDLNDGEVYSFTNLSKRVTDLEAMINSAESTTLYNYNYDAGTNSLIESSGNSSMKNYLPLISTSLKAIKSITDRFRALINTNTATAEQALSISKGRNQAHIFNTTEDMEAALSDPSYAGKYSVGDNIYIVDIDVPDWWISEVLTTADSETGYYYKIAQLETQKVDLSEIDAINDKLSGTVLWTNPNDNTEFTADQIPLDLQNYKRIKVIWHEYYSTTQTLQYTYSEVFCSEKDKYYIGVGHATSTVVKSAFYFNNDGVYIVTSNKSLIPYKIIGYKY